MKISIFLFRKLLFSLKSSFLYKITNIITILSLAFGVASLNIVLSSINGFENSIYNKLSKLNGKSQINYLFDDVFSPQELDIKSPKNGIEYIEKKSLIKFKNLSQNIVATGLNKKDFKNFEIFNDLDLKNNDKNYVFIGSTLANKLNVSIGDELALLNSQNLKNISQGQRFIFLEVKYIYSSGINEFDDRQVFVSIDLIKEFYNLEKSAISGWILFEKANTEVEYPLNEITTDEKYSILFEWINAQKLPIFFIFSLIAVVSFFGLFSSISILYDERKKHFAMMKSYGTPNKVILTIFMLQSIFLSLIGSFLGIVFSYIIIFLQEKYRFIAIDENIYFVNYIPMEFSFQNSAWIIFFSIIISFFISSLSLTRFFKININEVLKSS